jgi:DNA replication protein DnaC
MNPLHDTAREVCARRGINPADVADPPAFDPVAWRVRQAADHLAEHIPPRFRHAQVDHTDVARWVRGYLADPTQAGNLLLLGPTGTGKTHQAYGAVRRIATSLAHDGRGIDWRAVDHPTLNARLRPRDDGEHLANQHRYEVCDLLFLDDLGAGRATEWTADTLYRIVDTRWAHCRPTIAASNLDPDDLRVAVNDRVVSRLASGTAVVLKGGDRRAPGSQL